MPIIALIFYPRDPYKRSYPYYSGFSYSIRFNSIIISKYHTYTQKGDKITPVIQNWLEFSVQNGHFESFFWLEFSKNRLEVVFVSRIIYSLKNSSVQLFGLKNANFTSLVKHAHLESFSILKWINFRIRTENGYRFRFAYQNGSL